MKRRTGQLEQGSDPWVPPDHESLVGTWPSDHAVPHPSQVREHQHHLPSQGKAGFARCCTTAAFPVATPPPNSRRPLPLVLDSSALPTLRCSNEPLWRPAKLRRHVARLPNDHRVTTRTSARSLQQRVGLLRSMPTTPRKAKVHSSRSGAG